MKYEYKEEDEKGMSINENFDFVFAVKLNPVMRWILVLPMGIAGRLIVWGTLGWIVKMIVKVFALNGWGVFALTAPVEVIQSFMMIIGMAAIAPVARRNKFRAALALTVVPVAL